MNTKKIIAILLAMATVLTITAACGKEKNEEEVGTITNANGEVISTVGHSIEYVTGENGVTVLNSETLEPETIVHSYVEITDANGEAITNKNNEKVTVEYNDSPVESTLPQGKPVEENKKLLEKAFASGKFYMSMTMTMSEPSMPSLKVTTKMVMATNGKDIFYTADMNAAGIIKVGMGALQKDGKAYAFDTQNKTYCVSDESAQKLDLSSMLNSIGIKSGSNYIKSTEVTDNGKVYICEEYNTDFGVSKYYFDKTTEELKRIEHEKGDMGVIIVDKFIKNPGDNYFAVPSGYKEVSQDEFAKSFENMFGSLPF